MIYTLYRFHISRKGIEDTGVATCDYGIFHICRLVRGGILFNKYIRVAKEMALMGKVACFLGHRKVPDSPELRIRMKELVIDLIINHDVDTFLFGTRSDFSFIAHSIVTEIKERYPHIKRIKYRHDYPEVSDYMRPYIFDDYYEDNIFPQKALNAGASVYVERNQAMIDDSDFCIFYYNENYKPPKKHHARRYVCPVQTKSGTALAFRYASAKNKRIINFCKIIFQ